MSRFSRFGHLRRAGYMAKWPDYTSSSRDKNKVTSTIGGWARITGSEMWRGGLLRQRSARRSGTLYRRRTRQLREVDVTLFRTQLNVRALFILPDTKVNGASLRWTCVFSTRGSSLATR